MGKGLGKNQLQIGQCLFGFRFEDRGLDARQLAQRIYKVDRPTKSQMNAIWGALQGMQERKLIIYTGRMTLGGFRQWVLTDHGRLEMEMLKPKGRQPKLTVV